MLSTAGREHSEERAEHHGIILHPSDAEGSAAGALASQTAAAYLALVASRSLFPALLSMTGSRSMVRTLQTSTTMRPTKRVTAGRQAGGDGC